MRPAKSRVQLLGGRLLFRVAVAAGLLAVASPSANAQRQYFADTVSAKALAESLKVIEDLDRYTRSHPTDAAAWAHLGNLSLSLLDHSRQTTRGLDRLALENHALDGLHRAVGLDSTNASYWAALAKFEGPRGVSGRKQSDAAFAKALSLSRAKGDTGLLAGLLVERVVKEWSAYTRAGNYSFAPGPQGLSRANAFSNQSRVMGEESVWRAAGNDTAKDLARLLRSAIANVTQNVHPVSFESAGEISYLESAGYLGEAHDLAPSDPRAYRGLATLYAARGRWEELASLAADRTTRAVTRAEDSSATSVATTSGSNCEPAHSCSSAIAASGARAGL